MQPEVAAAIPELVERGLLPPDQAPRLLRAARGELVSVREELRLVLYAAVLLITGGAGLLVRQNLDRLGPVAVAALLGLAAAACLLWAWRTSPPFAWGDVASPNLAFDYVLLLGVLLAAADLAYVEWKFTPLGEEWPWHLLIVSLGGALSAFRFDSRVVFSLALSSFAAWRGVSVSFLEASFWRGSDAALRGNALACGICFVVLGAVLAATGRKAHFEGVAVHLGWLLLLGALGSWLLDGDEAALPFGLLAIAVGSALAWRSYARERFPRFAMGVVAAYAGLSRLIAIVVPGETLLFAWLTFSSVALVVLLFLAHRRIREDA